MTETDTHTRTRRRARFDRPDLPRVVDLLFVVALTTLALSGFASSFTGNGFWVVSVVGTLLGVGVATLFRALRWPVVGAVLALLVVFFLLGGPLCLRQLGDTAYVPGGRTLGELTDQVLFGWKDMLTTLPPVDGTGPLLVLPWTLGLVSGFVGAQLVHVRTSRSWLTAMLPVVACALSLAVVIALGVRHPQSLWLQGVGFAALALGWLALRGRRESAAVRGGNRGVGRAVAGVALLGLAAGLALPVANAAMGDDRGRTVLRSYVEPPFDIGRYPSLLASFRNYVELPPSAREEKPTNVYDEPLFTVVGPKAGTRVRLATLDRYDGMVWGASNDALPGQGDDDSFQRVSSVIDNPVEGDPVRATITLGKGYSGVWLPVVGALRSMDFESGEPDVKAESFRYNLATSTAVVPSGLHPGDRYSFTAVVPDDEVTPEDAPSSLAGVPADGTGFLDGPASKWTEDATTPMGRVFAVAEHLKTEGRYSDGVKKSERTYYPGHGIQRLSDGFVNAEVMVGNDEQYAATMALMANKIGVPARVVMGATVPDDGVVTGKDVSAWVELRLADGSWRTLPTEAFMSDRPPSEQQPQTQEPLSGTVVPPPAPIPPPSDLGEQSDSDLRAKMASKDQEKEEADEGLPAWIATVVVYVGIPLLVIALVLGSIVGAKALRRRRRRTAASVSTRFVGAWRELVDHARDLGQDVPRSRTTTRREQSGSIPSARAVALAREADSSVFGPSDPDPERAEAFWARVDKERRAMSRKVGRRQRWLAAISITTFRPGSLRR